MAAPTDRFTASQERLKASHRRLNALARFAAAARLVAVGRMRVLLGWIGTRLRLEPGRVTLSWWLAVSQVFIVLSVAGGISAYAIGRLHDLADEQGKSRVQLA